MTSVLLAFFPLMLLGCSGNKPAETAVEFSPAETMTATDYTGACIWDQVPLH